MNINNELKRYLDYCRHQKKLSQKSIKAYSIDLGQFVGHLDSAGECEITKAAICSYIAGLHDSCAPKTAKRKIASLRAFLNYLEFEEIIEVNPLRRIKTKFQEPKILPRVIPLGLIKKLIITAHKECRRARTDYEKFTTIRDLAIIETLFATGMRVSELCSLKTENIDLDSGCIHIMGKGKRERIIQIGNGEALSILRKYHDFNLSRISQEGFFFVNRQNTKISEQSVRFMLKTHCKRANIPLNITPHMFRHSFATLLLEEDVDIRYIQRMLGHSSIQTTQIYTQVTTEKQRQILTTKHPRNKFFVGI
jgi:integrase/recombinase XerD